MSTYQIRWSNGHIETCESYAEACTEVRRLYPDAEIGHDGDLTELGDRTLCWANEDASIDDDGQAAICSIYVVQNVEYE